jgi:hypothetical protein
MKKKVLCIFSLVLYLLVACTILSVKIEDEMMTEVYTYRRSNRNIASTGPAVLPMNLLYREDFQSHVYHLKEGTGWNTGLRVDEVENRSYTVSDKLMLTDTYSSWEFVALASRQPRVGEPVKIIGELTSGNMSELETAPADYLIIYPEAVPDAEMLLTPIQLENYEEMPELSDLLPDGASVVAQSDQAVAVHLEQAPVVFTTNSAKQTLSKVELPGWKVYNLADVESFLRQLPLIAMVAVMALVLPLGLWVYGCLLSRNDWENRILIRVNGGLIAALMVGILFVLRAIDLPASLLPLDIIFDRTHYTQVFGGIFSAMEDLGSFGGGMLQLAERMQRSAMGILATGIAVTVLIGAGELMAVMNRKRRERAE